MCGEQYPSWHPLSTVSEHKDECTCSPKKRTIGVGAVAGAVAYMCQDCGGYVP